MNWDQIRCSPCCLCLCGNLLTPLTLKQEVVGSNTTFTNFYFKFCRILQNLIGKPRLREPSGFVPRDTKRQSIDLHVHAFSAADQIHKTQANCNDCLKILISGCHCDRKLVGKFLTTH